jgi:hypothetical protein
MIHCEVRRRERHLSGCLDQGKRILPREDRAPGFCWRSATLSYQHFETLALRLAGYKNCVLGSFSINPSAARFMAAPFTPAA